MQDYIFRWVQLSDVHFRTENKEAFNSGLLQDRLSAELKKFGKLDAVFVAGDFRYAPDGEKNPKDVAGYLRKVAADLGIDASEIIIVPGNHDLERGETRTVVVKEVRSRYSPTQGSFSGEMLDSLEKDFGFFRDLQKELGQDCATYTSNPHTVADMGRCRILLLNTAITACGDGDNHALLVGSDYLRSLLKDTGKPVIAVGHHGLDMLLDEEKRVCTAYLEAEGVSLYLCGHSHTMWETRFGENGRQMSVGCLIQEDMSVIAGFSVGSLSADGTVELKCYVWNRRNLRWEPKPANDRVYPQLYGSVIENCFRR